MTSCGDPIRSHEFVLGLTHDVDRPYKRAAHALFYAYRDRDLRQLRGLTPGANPYWVFDDILELESELGVRSSFYFLREKSMTERPLAEWTDPKHWIEHLGRYDPAKPEIDRLVRRLDEGGWEVGLHGSYSSYDDRERLRREKALLERVLGHEVLGGRQHCLNLDRPETWRHHAEIGLRYDSTLGSSSTYGFQHGYHPLRPFDDEFVVFPLTLMERTLPVESDPERAWEECERLLREARDEGAVMTVLWHPTYLDPDHRPGYRSLYERLIERAQELGGWVGPLGPVYESLAHAKRP
ncbi:polysaccharide deacetylase family protein [Halegenticoccus tardaugens]|uniref:polysaccharide deacetylase family protein n=1 Tax=Halegenticoccus tardaugens TaxID=2071624 RepID=UPI00100B11AF|nr:polysaccharide deacetylase family protein [Halegenticoccus tardaugens]